MTTGVVRHACRHRVTARGVFGLGDCFTRPELGNDTLLLFVLRACCGGMCWPVDRPATHAAAGAAARGALIFCFGGFFHTLRSGWHERGGALLLVLRACCGGVGRWTGQPRMPPRERPREFWGILSHAQEWIERVRGGGFNDHGSGRRATSGEMARGGLVFVFSLEVAPVSEGDSFTR